MCIRDRRGRRQSEGDFERTVIIIETLKKVSVSVIFGGIYIYLKTSSKRDTLWKEKCTVSEFFESLTVSRRERERERERERDFGARIHLDCCCCSIKKEFI